MTTVVNHREALRTDPNYVFIGRPSKWGNPHPAFGVCPLCKHQHSHRDAIRAFLEYWLAPEQFALRIASLVELKDKRLGCPGWHCTPEACHGRIIADYVNAE